MREMSICGLPFLQRPRRRVSSLQGGQYCFHFRKPQGSHSRLQAKTFPRSFVDLQRCKSINALITPEGEPKVSRDSSVVFRSRGFVVSSGFKRQSDAVDAESLARWLRSVVKHVSQMCVTIFTKNLCPCTAQTVVRATNNGGVAFILPPCPMSLFKRWPASPRVVLGF